MSDSSTKLICRFVQPYICICIYIQVYLEKFCSSRARNVVKHFSHAKAAFFTETIERISCTLVCYVRFYVSENKVSLFFIFIYLALPTRAGSPQQHMPIIVGPFCLTHPVNFPCGRKPEYPEETHDFRQSVDFFTLFT